MICLSSNKFNWSRVPPLFSRFQRPPQHLNCQPGPPSHPPPPHVLSTPPVPYSSLCLPTTHASSLTSPCTTHPKVCISFNTFSSWPLNSDQPTYLIHRTTSPRSCISYFPHGEVRNIGLDFQYSLVRLRGFSKLHCHYVDFTVSPPPNFRDRAFVVFFFRYWVQHVEKNI